MSRVFRRPTRRAVAGALVLFALHPLAETAGAATLVWQNAAGGSAANAGNWNPVQVPIETDVLRFDMANTYTATLPLAVDSVATQQLWGGDVTLDCTSPHGVRTGFHVASLAGQIATARLLSGTLRGGWSMSVGAGAGAAGTLRVNGANANLGQNVAGVVPAGPVLNIGGSGTGAGGTGDLIVRSGGLVEPALRINVGRDAGSIGTLSVKGEGVFNSIRRRSSVIADSSASDCQVGMDGAQGVVEVLDGALLRLGRDLRLSDESGDVSTVTIGGAGVIDSARIRVKDDLFVGTNPSTTAGAAGGTANVTVDALGVLVVDDSTVVGDPDGSSSTITIHDDGRMVTKHLILQQPSGASMVLQGGLLQIKGGTLSTSTNRLEFPGDTQPRWPVIQLLNGANAAFVGTTADAPLIVATTGAAEIQVTGGSVMTANGGSPVCGDVVGSNGTVRVTSGGQFSTDRALVLGQAGVGWLRLESGGTATVNGLNTCVTASGIGNLDVHDAGSVLNCSGPFNVGGTTFVAGGASSDAVVRDGAVINLTAPILSGTIWPSHDVQANAGGQLNLSGTLNVRGDLALDGGNVAGGVIALRGNGRIVGTGSVGSTILGGTDTTVSILATGPLTLGRDVPGGGVLMRGALDAGSFSVTLVDPDSAIVGNVTLAGGELILPPGGGVVETDKRLVGVGTIRGPFTPRGYVISAGASGLQFAGTMAGTGQSCGGDQFVFLNGGGFEGAGTINAKVRSEVGSLIRATGVLSLGQLFAPNAILLRGRVETGGYQLDLRGITPFEVEGELVLDRGGITGTSSQPLHVATAGRLEGRGTILPNVIVGGTVAPGFSAGELSMISDLAFELGTYEAELGNHEAGEWDTLTVTGVATLSGTLDLLRLPTFAAATGDSFQIISCGSRIGTFNNVTLDGAPLAGEFTVAYGTNGVWIVAQQTTVGVNPRPGSQIPTSLRLAALSSPSTRPAIELAMPTDARVSLRVHDVQGREVGELYDAALAAGRHRFELARELTGTGVYFVRAAIGVGAGTTVRTARVVRTR